MGAGSRVFRFHFRAHEEPRAEAEDFCGSRGSGGGWGWSALRLTLTAWTEGGCSPPPFSALRGLCQQQRLPRQVCSPCVCDSWPWLLSCPRLVRVAQIRWGLSLLPGFLSFLFCSSRNRYSPPTCCQVSHQGFLCLWFTSGRRTRCATEQAEATAWGLTHRYMTSVTPCGAAAHRPPSLPVLWNGPPWPS